MLFAVFFHEFPTGPLVLHVFIIVPVDHFERAVTDLLGYPTHVFTGVQQSNSESLPGKLVVYR